MATRKSLVIVSGLFQELNTSSDKLDFGGNTTADLTENTNLYHTTARARGAISIASGEGLTYNSSTGELGTSSIPNSQLANSSVTIGGTAVALGATCIERHITLDRSMYGSDQSASLEEAGLSRLVNSIKKFPKILGKKKNGMVQGEESVAKKLRYWE